jgi:hypothetical protein
MTMTTIPEDQAVDLIVSDKKVVDGATVGSAKRVAVAAVMALALLLVVVLGNDLVGASSYRRLELGLPLSVDSAKAVEEDDRQLVRRRLQVSTSPPAPTPAPAPFLPSVQTDFNMTVCGTCALPVLGPFVTILTDTFSSAGWDAKVSIRGRSACSQCGSTLEGAASDSPNRFLQDGASEEMFGFEIVQVPNENATASLVNTTEPAALNSTSRINVQACLNNATIVNQILVQVSILTSQATGNTVGPFIFQSVSIVVIILTIGDDELNLGIPTAAPSTAANQVGNRLLMGRRYLQDLGQILSTAEGADILSLPATSGDLSGSDYDDEDEISEDEDQLQCKCVACEDDLRCGGLWYGSVVKTPEPVNRTKIHLVISHCKTDLDWLEDFTEDHVVDSVTVISKCGAEVKGAPEGTDVLSLPNIGRCDHTYGYYMAYMLEEKVPIEDRENAVVFFLKDDISAGNLHQDGSWNSFSDMVLLAGSDRGFACGIQPSHVDAGPNRYFLSAYHEYETLKEFSMHSYSRNIKGYSSDTVNFLSGFNNIDEWSRSLPGNPEPQEIVQVCYGGVFAASVSNILNQDPALWKSITQSLSRGNNIQEGHFAERSWARLLSTPLEHFQIKALSDTADGVYLNEAAMHGPLTRTPKIYIHAGAQATSVAAVEDALFNDAELLNIDGYRAAVHGHPELGIDIDRLAACMWNGFEASVFTPSQVSSAFCPPQMLRNLKDFLDHSMKHRQDVIISNPWLARDSTADALGHFLDSKWEVHPVVFYRRYYDWITQVFLAWRDGNHFEPDSVPISTIRQIDFIREYCKRLFYGSMIPDDAPYRAFSSQQLSKVKTHHDRQVSSFHPSLPIEEMTDLKEYTYFIAKQYEDVSRFADKVHIVNYHDHAPLSNLYCNVLSHARNSCKMAAKKEQLAENHKDVTTAESVNHDIQVNEEHSYVELALGAYMKGRLTLPLGSSGLFHSQVKHWAKAIRSKLNHSTLSFSDLPIECLEDFEMQRLLQVSLSYERALLPDFFASDMGESDLRSDFAKRTFCSVDVAATLQDRQWEFLFDLDETQNLLEAFVHIGGPNTNSHAIQETLIMDRNLFEKDNYFMAIHGSSRSSPEQDYIVNNMLFDADLIGPCLWDQQERDHVALTNPAASVCQPGMLPRFRRFLDDAESERKSLVISNEWLSHASSERGLDQLLDAEIWNVNIVLYYRRYFEWLSSMYGSWRSSISVDVVHSLGGKTQFVDFCRLVNGRLFEAGDIGIHDEHQVRMESFVDLVDIQEYTYQLWRQFTSVDRFQTSVHIVDSHDEGMENLYCNVFFNAQHACNSTRMGAAQDVGSNIESSAQRSLVDRDDPFVIEDLVIGSYYGGLDILDQEIDDNEADLPPLDSASLQYWADVVRSNMEKNSLSVTDLPKNCLTESELDLLQDVSLAFEKVLLPNKYNNGGAQELVQQMAVFNKEDIFCSIDVEALACNEELVQILFSTNGHLSPPMNRRLQSGTKIQRKESNSRDDDMVDVDFF